MSVFNAIRKNKILSKISESTVSDKYQNPMSWLLCRDYSECCHICVTTVRPENLLYEVASYLVGDIECIQMIDICKLDTY